MIAHFAALRKKKAEFAALIDKKTVLRYNN